MISATEVRKNTNKFYDAFFKSLEAQIKKASEQGKGKIWIQENLSDHIETLENLGYKVSKYSQYNYTIEW